MQQPLNIAATTPSTSIDKTDLHTPGVGPSDWTSGISMPTSKTATQPIQTTILHEPMQPTIDLVVPNGPIGEIIAKAMPTFKLLFERMGHLLRRREW